MNKHRERRYVTSIQKVITAFKGKSQYKYFFFLVYIFIGTLFFYFSYTLNEKNIFNFPQYTMNQKFDVTTNVSMYLRDVNYSEKNHTLYLTFEDQRSLDTIQKRDSYPITYRAKIIEGPLLNTKSYSTISNGFIVEINQVPTDFKSLKLSLVLNDFDQTNEYNKDQAPFFYVNNDEQLKNKTIFTGTSKQSEHLIELSKHLNQQLIRVKEEEIQRKQKQIKQLNEKILDYKQTKELPMNEKEERSIAQIDSEIDTLNSQIEECNQSIQRKEKQIRTYKKEMTDEKLITKSLTEMRFSYDIHSEK